MEEPNILFVDDDLDILDMVEKYLKRHEYRIHTCDNGLNALKMLQEKDFAVVFTDYKMPELNGLELLAAIKKYRPATEVVIITGYGSMESAIQAMKFGSYDYLQKPFKLDHLKLIIDRIIEEKKLEADTKLFRAKSRQRHKYGDLIGISPKMQEIYELIDRLQINDPTVLIMGESGTGKELVAKTIHENSGHKDLPFVPVNCGSLGKDISSKELTRHIQNLLDTVNKGTIYLDELTELTPELRDVVSKFFTDERKDSFRIIAGTRYELEDVIASGVFKNVKLDLLDMVQIKMPPLRERKEDIILLINHFIDKTYRKNNKRMIGIAADAVDILLAYHWPGNLIQLQNVVERAFAMGVENCIEPEDLPAEIKTFGEISKLD